MSLKDEIDNDPIGRVYSAMNDIEVTTSLNTVNREIPRLIPYPELISYLIEKEKWSGILVAGHDETHAVYADCLMFISIANNTNLTHLDLSNPAIVTMLVNIKGGGLLENVNQTDIVAMSKQLVSRATEIGEPFVWLGQVQRARA